MHSNYPGNEYRSTINAMQAGSIRLAGPIENRAGMPRNASSSRATSVFLELAFVRGGATI
jgi:hypothetical protein